MPSTYQSSKSEDREEFPEVAAEIGEDPARFLDVPLIAPDQIGSSPFLLAAARISSIEDIETANAWIRVEEQLDRGPRKGVLKRLHDRKEEIDTAADEPSASEADTTAATAGGDA